MKKIVFIYMAILVGIFTGFSWVDRKSDYVIERSLWNIHQQYMRVIRTPETVPEQTFEELIGRYEDLLVKFPHTSLTQYIHLEIAQVYVLKKDYLKARERFSTLKATYPDNEEFLADVTARIAKTYELAGDWAQAYGIYQSVIQEYPATTKGLGLPLYIASYYKNKKDLQSMLEAYSQASGHFQELASQNTGLKLGFDALHALASTYIEQARWQEAIHTLEDILRQHASAQYMTPQRIDTVIKTINIIAAFHLDNYDVAIDIYNKFLDQFPQNKFSGYIQKHIDAFNQLKQKGVRVKQGEQGNLSHLLQMDE